MKKVNKKIKDKPLKSYVFKITEEDHLEIFQDFQNMVVYKNTTPVAALIELCKDYVKSNLPKNMKIVTESQLREICKKEGLTTSRSSLKKYRDGSLLEDKKSKWWHSNEDGNVVYNLNPVLDYLKSRKPFSRISK